MSKSTLATKAEILIKPWPEDGTVDFDELVEPVVKAIKFAYNLRRKNLNKDIPYKGYERKHCLSTCLSIGSTLSAENLQYEQREQGRSALETIVGVAVQLGFEQGIRYQKEQHKTHDLITDLIDKGQKQQIRKLEAKIKELEDAST